MQWKVAKYIHIQWNSPKSNLSNQIQWKSMEFWWVPNWSSTSRHVLPLSLLCLKLDFSPADFLTQVIPAWQPDVLLAKSAGSSDGKSIQSYGIISPVKYWQTKNDRVEICKVLPGGDFCHLLQFLSALLSRTGGRCTNGVSEKINLL